MRNREEKRDLWVLLRGGRSVECLPLTCFTASNGVSGPSLPWPPWRSSRRKPCTTSDGSSSVASYRTLPRRTRCRSADTCPPSYPCGDGRRHVDLERLMTQSDDAVVMRWVSWWWLLCDVRRIVWWRESDAIAMGSHLTTETIDGDGGGGGAARSCCLVGPRSKRREDSWFCCSCSVLPLYRIRNEHHHEDSPMPTASIIYLLPGEWGSVQEWPRWSVTIRVNHLLWVMLLLRRTQHSCSRKLKWFLRSCVGRSSAFSHFPPFFPPFYLLLMKGGNNKVEDISFVLRSPFNVTRSSVQISVPFNSPWLNIILELNTFEKIESLTR